MEQLDQKVKDKRILVLGDVMLDEYIWGAANRISPEADVQVVNVKNRTYAPGGAANVATNITALGGKAVLIGVAGEDLHRDKLEEELTKQNVETFLFSDGRPTTTKTRIMGRRQQLLRYDEELTKHIDPDIEDIIISRSASRGSDAIIVSDYAKGVVTQSLYNKLKASAQKRNIPLLVDVKPANNIDYAGATVIKTNHSEACELAKVKEHNGDGIEAVGKKLVQELQADIIITRGEKGVSIFRKDTSVYNIETKAKQVYDVTGAGDTFLAAFTLAYVSGIDFVQAANIANHASGIKVGKVGTASVTLEELMKEL